MIAAGIVLEPIECLMGVGVHYLQIFARNLDLFGDVVEFIGALCDLGFDSAEVSLAFI